MTPLVSHPPCSFYNQILHMVHGKLPGFMPIPAMYKIIKTVHSSVLHKHPLPLKTCSLIKILVGKNKKLSNPPAPCNSTPNSADQCSPTCPSLCLHGYGGPTGCPWVELCTSQHGWQGGWHLPSCTLSSSLMPHEGHPWLPWPNMGRTPFLLPPLSIVCCRLLPPPSFSSIHVY